MMEKFDTIESLMKKLTMLKMSQQLTTIRSFLLPVNFCEMAKNMRIMKSR